MKTYLQSFKKFLEVKGHLSVCKSTTMSPKLVTISTDILSYCLSFCSYQILVKRSERELRR